MKVIKNISDMRAWSESRRISGKRIGFVPTMGFLHEGHLSLIRTAKEKCEFVVVSIFVNPAQFGPNEDFSRYPRDFDRDRQMCLEEGVDIIFYPAVEELYPTGYKTYVITEDISKILCGVSRPDHFRGVTTIVAKLFNIVNPHVAVFGQKDAQQAIIIKRMISDLDFGIETIIAPIIREPDGLAMSSRNKYLSETDKKEAIALYRSLKLARLEMINKNNDVADIREKMTQLITSESSGRIDYIEFRDADSLVEEKIAEGSVLVAIAVYFGKTRLIDNMIV
ncbi:MAG: pantoate--beta-alanine ligase, partial [Calditrichaceae bacterium]